MDTKKAALTVLSIALKIVIYAVVIMGIFRLGGSAFEYGHSVFQEKAVDAEPGRSITVTIEEDSSATDIAKMLENRGLVEDWKLFFIQVKVSKYAKTLEPGTYILSTAMKPREMMAVMSGESEDDPEDSDKEEESDREGDGEQPDSEAQGEDTGGEKDAGDEGAEGTEEQDE